MILSGISFDEKLNFFKTYYKPTWSIIFWLIQAGTGRRNLRPDDISNAKSAHSMAMFLHAIDDHLQDGQLPVTHIALLIRSQSWMIMNNALKGLAEGINGGNEIIQGFINDYYSSISSSQKVKSLDEYCELFRKQMATGMIAPVLLVKKIYNDEGFAQAIEDAYGSFGIAWRLLDDINDIEADMAKSVPSSVYVCLSDKIKKYWEKSTGEKNRNYDKWIRLISNHILENGIIDRIEKRILTHLETAAEMADQYDIKGWADELRCLIEPFRRPQE